MGNLQPALIAASGGDPPLMTATALAMAAFILLSILSKQVPFVLIAVLIPVGMLLEWQLAKVRLAERQ